MWTVGSVRTFDRLSTGTSCYLKQEYSLPRYNGLTQLSARVRLHRAEKTLRSKFQYAS